MYDLCIACIHLFLFSSDKLDNTIALERATDNNHYFNYRSSAVCSVQQGNVTSYRNYKIYFWLFLGTIILNAVKVVLGLSFCVT